MQKGVSFAGKDGGTTAGRYDIDRSDLAERVYQALKREILSGRLVPGQRLSLEESAQRFGVSITPVRDALRLLAADGLVELTSRRGAFVTQLSATFVEEVYQSREILECAAVDALLGQGVAVISELENLLGQMAITRVGETHSDYLSYVRFDQRFHQLIVDGLGNRKLSEVYASLHTHTLVARALYRASDQRASDTAFEHEAIVAALRNGNANAARAAIRDHLQRAKLEVLQKMPADVKRSAFNVQG